MEVEKSGKEKQKYKIQESKEKGQDILRLEGKVQEKEKKKEIKYKNDD